MELEFLINGIRRLVSVEKKDGRYLIVAGIAGLEADVRSLADGSLSFLVDGRSYLATVAESAGLLIVSVGGDSFTLEPAARQDAGGGERRVDVDRRLGDLVRAPLPGRVVKVGVVEGETVRRNQTLAIVEAMKMENEVKSSRDGKVKRVLAAAGDFVEADQPLFEVEGLA